MTELSKPLLLIGMMGAGKTTLGRPVAERLGVRFYDLDKEVERAAGTSIADIFRDRGEAAFRELERKTLLRLLEAGPGVIAGGGGVGPQKAAVNVWLDGELETLYRRSAGEIRPKRGTLKEFRALYEARKKGYQRAEIHIDSGTLGLTAAVERILKALDKV